MLQLLKPTCSSRIQSGLKLVTQDFWLYKPVKFSYFELDSTSLAMREVHSSTAALKHYRIQGAYYDNLFFLFFCAGSLLLYEGFSLVMGLHPSRSMGFSLRWLFLLQSMDVD